MAIIGNSIQYIEDYITEDITADTVAKEVCVSPFYFQKGFSMLCGFSIAEYIRNRRLAMAGRDLVMTFVPFDTQLFIFRPYSVFLKHNV